VGNSAEIFQTTAGEIRDGNKRWNASAEQFDYTDYTGGGRLMHQSQRDYQLVSQHHDGCSLL